MRTYWLVAFLLVVALGVVVAYLTRPSIRRIYAHVALPGGEVVFLERHNGTEEHWWTLADREGPRITHALGKRSVMFSGSGTAGATADATTLYLVEAQDMPGGSFDEGGDVALVAYDRQTGDVRWKTSIGTGTTRLKAPVMPFIHVANTLVTVSLNEHAGHRPWFFGLDAASGKLVWQSQLDLPGDFSDHRFVHGDAVLVVSVHGDGDRSVRVIRRATGEVLHHLPGTREFGDEHVVTRDAMAWIRMVSERVSELYVLPLDDEGGPRVIKLPVAIGSYTLWGVYRGAWIVSAFVFRRDSPSAEVGEVHAIEPDGRVRWTVETPWLGSPRRSYLTAGSRVQHRDLPDRLPLPVRLTNTVWLDLAQGRLVDTGPNLGTELALYEGGTIVVQRQHGLRGPVVVLDAEGTPHGYRLEQVQPFSVSHVADHLWWIVLAEHNHVVPGDLPWVAIDLVTGKIVARHANPPIVDDPSALALLPPR